MHNIRRSLYLITFGSWLASPLALGLAHIEGFSNSKQVLIYFFAIAIQAPYLIILNDSLAPVLLNENNNKSIKLILIASILISLFTASFYSFYHINVLKLTLMQSALSGILLVTSAFISFLSSSLVLKSISTTNSAIVSPLVLTFLGALPSVIVFIVFLFYALFTTSFSDSYLDLLLPGLILPNVVHFIVSRRILKNLPSTTNINSSIIIYDYKKIFFIFIAFIALPININWSNDLREDIGSKGSMGWILLATNMLFTFTLVYLKSDFLMTRKNFNRKSLNINKIFLLISVLILCALVALLFDLSLIKNIILLFLSFCTTILIVVQLRFLFSFFFIEK
jgi:hypothetical protein